MSVLKQVNVFLFFILLGIIISCIFDIFRALRKMKKENSIYIVMIQDIIFFMVITIVTIIYMINILNESIRFYMIVAVLVGVEISRKLISKYLIKFYTLIFGITKGCVKFLCVPLELHYSIFCKIVKKVVKKSCKMFLVMINLERKLFSIFEKLKNSIKKRDINESKSKFRRKKDSKKEKKVS